MDGIRIEVTGNIARVIEKPARITSGTVGLPVEFTFDSPWEGLSKVAVFRAGHFIKTEDNPEAGVAVPWEVLTRPNVWLSIGVYGISSDGAIAIPTTWANVCVIHVGVSPDGDPSLDPSLPIWQEMKNDIEDFQLEMKNDIEDFQQGITADNEALHKKLDDLNELKGEKGDPGYTPQKGIDYFTEEDIASLNLASIQITTWEEDD